MLNSTNYLNTILSYLVDHQGLSLNEASDYFNYIYAKLERTFDYPRYDTFKKVDTPETTQQVLKMAVILNYELDNCGIESPTLQTIINGLAYEVVKDVQL